MCSFDKLRLVPTIYHPHVAGAPGREARTQHQKGGRGPAAAWSNASTFERRPAGGVAAAASSSPACCRLGTTLPRLSTVLWAACVTVPVVAATLVPVLGLMAGASLAPAGILAAAAVVAIASLMLATGLVDARESRMPAHPRLDATDAEGAS